MRRECKPGRQNKHLNVHLTAITRTRQRVQEMYDGSSILNNTQVGKCTFVNVEKP